MLKFFSIYFSFIKNNKDKISNINLLGGEPLLQKPNIKLLNLVPDSYYYILTNLSTEIEGNKLAEQLLANPKVSWGISFETVGDRFEYVRNGADWNRLVHNLRLLNHHKVPNIDVHPLYCIYSAFNLCEFYEFLEGEGYFNNIYWQLLQNIKGLDVFRSPKSLKIKAVAELELCISRYEDKFNITNISKGFMGGAKYSDFVFTIFYNILFYLLINSSYNSDKSYSSKKF